MHSRRRSSESLPCWTSCASPRMFPPPLEPRLKTNGSARSLTWSIVFWQTRDYKLLGWVVAKLEVPTNLSESPRSTQDFSTPPRPSKPISGSGRETNFWQTYWGTKVIIRVIFMPEKRQAVELTWIGAWESDSWSTKSWCYRGSVTNHFKRRVCVETLVSKTFFVVRTHDLPQRYHVRAV